MRIGIFFGGKSREREISFAGGRTVYDNLDKSIFEAVPIFADSLGNYILLDWQYLYKGSIRDFYPPTSLSDNTTDQFQVYIESLKESEKEQYDYPAGETGRVLKIEEIPQLIDFAFLALHGNLGEDGQIQGLLESLGVPYSGSGIRASSIGMDKSYQKKLMESGGYHMPEMVIIKRREWLKREGGFNEDMIIKKTGLPLVVRPANQGSSIGVSIINNKEDINSAIDAAFFIERLQKEEWTKKTASEKVSYMQVLTDIRTGVGFPLQIRSTKERYYHPVQLLEFIDTHFDKSAEDLEMEGFNSEHTVVLEEFIEGREFSCVVIRGEDRSAIALPPTEILKGREIFDYRSKYLPGLSRKQTPINLPEEEIERIRKECEKLYKYLGFNTYARIDGFIKEDGRIFLNDPNTTSGMLPSSFFFHQAAETGLNPSQFLSYIIRTSIEERIETSTELGLYEHKLEQLDLMLSSLQKQKGKKKKIAILLGGYSSERHISVESGRNIYEKLASSSEYEPIPIFVSGDHSSHQMHQIPVNLLLKDNADDIRDKINNYKEHKIIQKIQKKCESIVMRYTNTKPIYAPVKISYRDLKEQADGVFIALHGRPGEDGEIQGNLEKLGIAYNGSVSESARVTINKYETLQKLRKAGLTVTDQLIIAKADYRINEFIAIEKAEGTIGYPMIAKPVDDGCSSAVKLIKSRQELSSYLSALFRETELVSPENSAILGLKPREEFPIKKEALIEALIHKEDAEHFLEITGGILTNYNDKGDLEYEIFEPSEALASGEVLSLEEKFLAGEGQNITPARYIRKNQTYSHEQISAQVRASLKKAAETLKVTGYARIDAFVRIYKDGRAETIIIEINSLPGMTPATCIFHQCALAGYKPYEFIDQILKFGLKRSKQISVE